MPELSPNIVDQMLASCQAGAAEAAAALSRAFDAQFKITVGDPGNISPAGLPKELNAPGLALVFSIGDSGVAFVLPESTGLLPEWYTAPDPTGQSKLATLAQELGANFLPAEYLPGNHKVAGVDNLANVLTQCELVEGAAMIPLVLISSAERQGTAWLIWPVTKPQAALTVGAAKQKSTSAFGASTPVEFDNSSALPPPADVVQRRNGKRQLPPYTRSLLRVAIPLVVTLAEKKQKLSRIIELGPGQIIQFDKSCEEALTLEMGNCKIAAGEVVKVGDKFGLRITSIVPPGERFVPVRPNK